MTIPVIAFFNNKGGVGKTSLVYHLGWMFEQLGVTVLAADLDPQANLTAACLDDEKMIELIEGSPAQTVFAFIRPLIQRTGDVQAPALVPLGENERYFLLPGDLRLSEFEQQLSDEWANTRNGDIGALRLTSALWRMLQIGAKQVQAAVILVDMGPNLGAINRTLLISSDHIVVPLAPDLFSLLGLQNLGKTLARWRTDWRDALKRSAEHSDLDFALPEGNMQPIGYIVVQHAERENRPVRAYQHWISQIPGIYRKSVLNAEEVATTELDHDQNRLGLVRHYHNLMAMAQEARKPIFALKPADGAVAGHVKIVKTAYKNFQELALTIADRIGVSIPVAD
ncbi:MAG: ParA family protein [Chloroflexota bacterium]|nr:ParA family protein [Chloroflexota bacterium]